MRTKPTTTEPRTDNIDAMLRGRYSRQPGPIARLLKTGMERLRREWNAG